MQVCDCRCSAGGGLAASRGLPALCGCVPWRVSSWPSTRAAASGGGLVRDTLTNFVGKQTGLIGLIWSISSTLAPDSLAVVLSGLVATAHVP